MSEYLKIPEVARRLDVSEKTARRYIRSAELPSAFIGGAYRVSEEDLANYMKAAIVEPEEVDAHPKAAAAAPVSLSQWFEARCGHSFLALSKDELQERFDALAEDGPERRELGLKINNEFNEFCAFPRNVTTQERLSMRKMIRDSISAVAVKHQLALFESGLYPEYAEELSRVFDLERTLDADEASA